MTLKLVGEKETQISTRTYHRQVPLPGSAAGTVTGRARALQGVTPTLAAVQGDVAVGPGHTAAETAVELVA